MNTSRLHPLLYFLLFTFNFSLVFAQDQADALRYSDLGIGGTARFMAMGGAFTAVGGDMSSLAYNPAGIGVFLKSQFCFTPGFSMQNVTSNYNGMSSTAQQSMMNIQNAGWIGTWKNKLETGMWKTISFGIVYNRTNDFNSSIDIQGNNSKNSLLDEFVNNANGTNYANLDPFTTAQAFNAGNLIDTAQGSEGSKYNNIIDHYLNGKNSIFQQDLISNSGSMGETDISLGGNYNNKLDIGVSFGIPDIRFTQNASYTETPNYTDTIWGLQNYNYTTTVNTTGAGINFKIGAIYRILDWLRIGVGVHTPTWFNLTDNYSSLITANYAATTYYPQGGGTWTGTQDGSPATGNYNYTLTTPMRAMGGLAVIIHHQAIISADYQWVDYSSAQFNPLNVYNPVNQAIEAAYVPQSNFRVGAEWVLYPFSIRAGYAYYSNPYSPSSGNNSLKASYSAGFGIKFNRCFIDLAYVLTQYSENFYIYDPYLVNAAANKSSISNVAITFGVNF